MINIQKRLTIREFVSIQFQQTDEVSGQLCRNRVQKQFQHSTNNESDLGTEEKW